MRCIANFLSQFDLFGALPTLRVRGSTQVTNWCGGFLSICFFIFFTYQFIDSIVSTIKLEKIQAKQSIEQLNYDRQIHNIKMAIGLQTFNLSAMGNVFQVQVSSVGRAQRSFFIPLTLKQCNYDDWKQLTQQKYQKMRIQTHLCLDIEDLSIYGEYGSLDLRTIYFNLTICDNLTSPITCAPITNINYLLQSLVIFPRYLACSLVILDKSFNLKNQNPIINKIYQNTLWLIFNRKQFVVTQVFLGTYEITTDISFTPTTILNKTSGYFVYQSIISSSSNQNVTGLLAQGYIIASSVHKSIERVYGKFDEVLSYVGGLFGIVLSFIGFFIMSFNQYKYQLRVSEGAFSRSDNFSRQENFNFLKYLKYSLFDWIKFLFRCQPNWEDCKAIQQSREQANQQIDVKHLLQRLAHVQLILKNSDFNQKGDIIMYMVKSNSIEEAKRRRNIVEYCNKYSLGDSGTTIGTLEKIQAIFNMSNSSKSQLFLLNGSSKTFSKSFFKEQQKKSSLQIMQQYLEKYAEKYKLEDNHINQSQDDKEIQEQLTDAFFSMRQEQRKQIVKNIAIGILYRLSKRRKQGNKNVEKNGQVQLKQFKNKSFQEYGYRQRQIEYVE